MSNVSLQPGALPFDPIGRYKKPVHRKYVIRPQVGRQAIGGRYQKDGLELFDSAIVRALIILIQER